MDAFSLWHWMIVIAVVLLLFGRGKVSDLMGDIAHGIKAFKKGMADDESVEGRSDTVIAQQAGPAKTESERRGGS